MKRNIQMAGLALTVMLWVVLCWIFLDRAGITLYNLLIVMMSGACVIVPLAKMMKRPGQ